MSNGKPSAGEEEEGNDSATISHALCVSPRDSLFHPLGFSRELPLQFSSSPFSDPVSTNHFFAFFFFVPSFLLSSHCLKYAGPATIKNRTKEGKSRRDKKNPQSFVQFMRYFFYSGKKNPMSIPRPRRRQMSRWPLAPPFLPSIPLFPTQVLLFRTTFSLHPFYSLLLLLLLSISLLLCGVV